MVEKTSQLYLQHLNPAPSFDHCSQCCCLFPDHTTGPAPFSLMLTHCTLLDLPPPPLMSCLGQGLPLLGSCCWCRPGGEALRGVRSLEYPTDGREAAHSKGPVWILELSLCTPRVLLYDCQGAASGSWSPAGNSSVRVLGSRLLLPSCT